MDEGLIDEIASLEEEHWWFLGRGLLVRALVERECARRGGRVGRLVDVGSGTGAILRELSPLAAEAVGVEVDERALALSRGRGLDIRVAPADRLPFADATVDVATAFDVLEHLDDDVAAAAELRRVLRAGGAAIVTVPAYRWLWSEHDVRHHHRRRYTRTTLRRTLESAGLEVHRLGYLMSLLLPLALVERLAARARRRPPRGLAVPPAPVNALLLGVVAAERRLVLAGGLPFGLTVFAVAGPAART